MSKALEESMKMVSQHIENTNKEKLYLEKPNINSRIEKYKTKMKTSLGGPIIKYEQAEESANLKINQLRLSSVRKRE